MAKKPKYKDRQVLKPNNPAWGKRNPFKKFKAIPHPMKSIRGDDGRILPKPKKVS